MKFAFARPLAATAALFALSWLLAVAPAAPAAAHDGLLSANPADGARLDQAPTAVMLRFAARLDPRLAKIAVTGGDGASVTTGAFAASGAQLTQPVSITASGRYTVAFRVVSRDGHPVSGKTTFTVIAAAPTHATSPSAAAQPDVAASSAPPPSPAAAAPQPEPDGLSGAVTAAAAIAVAAGAAIPLLIRRRRRSPR
ncbi:copper resistance CopC family protein [Catellatospora sp. NPDC049111]|uniref:copper resistance CopC family protein n=1 Tax=Catellatospora sp. NPDC049111 TaxID=3155271 RepID=UPI0033E90356